MRSLHRLTTLRIKTAGPGKLLDGGGLWLLKRDSGGGKWFLRVTVNGRRREMGFGSLDVVSLKEARKAAEKWRAVVVGGHDPIKVRDAERRAAAKVRPTLAAVTSEAFEARRAGLKNDGDRWLSALARHVLPTLGRTPIEDLDQGDLAQVLRPLWADRSPTAKTALARLKVIFEYAVARGLSVDVTAPAKAAILLGKSAHVRVSRKSVPWQEIPAFYEALVADAGSVPALALRFLTLTATRSAETRELMLDEISGNVWTIPGSRTKNGRGHRVALSGEALHVIDEARPFARDGLLFASQRGGSGPLSDATLSRYVRDRYGAATPHGLRSSFRTWAAEATDTPREVAEAVLGHVVDGSTEVERAYRRSDFLERRLVLMARWADHVTGRVSGEVVSLHGLRQ